MKHWFEKQISERNLEPKRPAEAGFKAEEVDKIRELKPKRNWNLEHRRRDPKRTMAQKPET
jgi:hypothetical protein